MSNKVKFYDWDNFFDFGQCSGKSILEVFKKSPSYIDWCFKYVDTFCISDEIFNQLPVVISLQNDTQNKMHLTKLENLHSAKKNKLKSSTKDILKEQSYYPISNDFDWLKEVSGTDDPEIMNDVYWNLD